MKNNIFFVLAVAVFCLSLSSAASAERAGQMISIGGGCFGNMTAAGAEILYHRPFNFLDSDKIYGKIGLAVADSLNMYPTKDWRRFLLLYIDGVMYFYGNTYLGGGLNIPLKVTDSENGNLGGEIYLGTDIDVYHRGKIYMEAGYSVVRRFNYERFEGLHFMVGWRYELTPAPAPKKEIVSESTMPGSPALTPESAAINKTPSYAEAEREMIKAKINDLEDELKKVEKYITQLDEKIIKAKNAKAATRVLELKTTKLDSVMRAQSIKQQIIGNESRL